jgi:hypothetical protein
VVGVRCNSDSGSHHKMRLRLRDPFYHLPVVSPTSPRSVTVPRCHTPSLTYSPVRKFPPWYYVNLRLSGVFGTRGDVGVSFISPFLSSLRSTDSAISTSNGVMLPLQNVLIEKLSRSRSESDGPGSRKRIQVQVVEHDRYKGQPGKDTNALQVAQLQYCNHKCIRARLAYFTSSSATLSCLVNLEVRHARRIRTERTAP